MNMVCHEHRLSSTSSVINMVCYEHGLCSVMIMVCHEWVCYERSLQ